MKKTARRVLTLVLTLVLICALAATAFAATTAIAEEGFLHFDMLATASIYQYSTNITVEAIAAAEEIQAMQGDIVCVYTYDLIVPQQDATFVTISEVKHVNEWDEYYSHSRAFSAANDNMLNMRHASYDVDVLVSTRNTSGTFAPDTLVVTYPD